MITIQLIINNNENTIRKTLESIDSLNGRVVAANVGANEQTIEICKQFNVEIVDINNREERQNRSLIRNRISSNGWNLWIEPWEVLLQGQEQIKNNTIKDTYHIQVFQNQTINKEIRYWHGEQQFKNPIFETIESKKSSSFPAIMFSSGKPTTAIEDSKSIALWQSENPTNNSIYYYKAINELALGKYDSFITFANEYLSRAKSANMSSIMLKYYLSQIQLRTGDLKNAIRNAMCCIIAQPAMSEFWCLVGDILYKKGKYEKAKKFYKNAKMIGQKRKNTDRWPIEIQKYQGYPNKMIDNIEKIELANLYGSG